MKVKAVGSGGEYTNGVLYGDSAARSGRSRGRVTLGRRRTVATFLGGTSTKNTAEDGCKNNDDEDWDTDFDPVACTLLHRHWRDIASGLVVVGIARAVGSIIGVMVVRVRRHSSFSPGYREFRTVGNERLSVS